MPIYATPTSPTSVCDCPHDPLPCDSPVQRKGLLTATIDEARSALSTNDDTPHHDEPSGVMMTATMDVDGKRELAWPTREELFSEPETNECDICSLPMGYSLMARVEGSAAISLVSDATAVRVHSPWE